MTDQNVRDKDPNLLAECGRKAREAEKEGDPRREEFYSRLGDWVWRYTCGRRPSCTGGAS